MSYFSNMDDLDLACSNYVNIYGLYSEGIEKYVMVGAHLQNVDMF